MAEKKKKRALLNKIVRAIIQLIFFISMPGAFVAGFSGIRYIFQCINKGEVIQWNSFMAVLVFLCVFTIIFGRYFCGYVCAFGSLGDFIYWVSGLIQTKIFKRKKQYSLPEKASPWLQKIKFVILAAIIMMCAFGVYDKIGSWSPWSVFSFFMALRPRILGYIPGFVILIIIICLMALKERFFCQYLCPMGAVFALLPHMPFALLSRKSEECLKGCSLCQRNCPVDIKLESDGFRNGECIGCEKCAGVCPKANINRWDRKLFRHEAIAAGVKAVVFFLVGVALGLCRFITF